MNFGRFGPFGSSSSKSYGSIPIKRLTSIVFAISGNSDIVGVFDTSLNGANVLTPFEDQWVVINKFS